MIIPDLKRMYTTAIAKRSPKGDEISSPTEMKPEITKDEDGQIDGRHAAAEDMIAAFHEKSAQKLSEAMANFLDMHMLRKEEEEEEDEAE